ncbi:hypothetical protein ACV07N_04015 [Roseivirga echinicomitans]
MVKQLERIERLHNLIRLKATGPAKECAQRLKISERQLFRILEDMKNLGAPIDYDKARGSYYYINQVKWRFGFKAKKEVRENG